jgi:hypothetical protein
MVVTLLWIASIEKHPKHGEAVWKEITDIEEYLSIWESRKVTMECNVS